MKPILFNTEMVRAILDDRKGATRRVADINPDIPCTHGEHEFVWDNFTGGKATGFVCRKCGFGVAPPHSRYPVGTSLFRPRYFPSDILYVRETWQFAYDMDGNDQCIDGTGRYLYYADDPAPFNDWIMPNGTHREFMPWRPSIHMPKDAARLFLRVKDVRVERLQNITEEQAEAEGAPKAFEYDTPEGPVITLDEDGYFVLGFKVVWNSTIPKDKLPLYGWDANPWVWVIEFERISKEEAQKGGVGNASRT